MALPGRYAGRRSWLKQETSLSMLLKIANRIILLSKACQRALYLGNFGLIQPRFAKT